MKLTVLVDNNTLIDRYFLGEPGVCYFIETGDRKILFDVGYSDAFLTNARKLSIDMLGVDTVVLSHGHADHTWGLMPLVYLYTEGILEDHQVRKPALVTHPLTLSSKKLDGSLEIGSALTKQTLSGYFDLALSREPVDITERLVFLGEIERTNDFEAQRPLGTTGDSGIEEEDFLFDDSALAYKSETGLVIITGCSHAGICNIVEHAKKVCNDDRVVDIIGGFHLLDPPVEQLQGTVAYLKGLHLPVLHACHCTDLKSKIALSAVADLEEVGVGLTLAYR